MSRQTELVSSGMASSGSTCESAASADASLPHEAELAPEEHDRDNEVLSLEALMLSRTFLYSLFHKALGGEPSGDLFKMMSDKQTVAVVDEYADADQDMADLKAFFSGLAEEADEAFIDAALGEYARAFVGPNRLLALPWESPYVSYEPVLFHKNTLAVRNAYRARGWKIKRYLHLPDDHVSLECGFMARLAKESLQAFEAGRLSDVRAQMVEQKLFIDEHMNTWLSEYAQGLLGSKKAPLYSRIAQGLAAFVRLDSVFAVEAINWIDEQTRFDETALETACAEPAERIASVLAEVDYFDEARETLSRLESLHLKNLEDNELCDWD